MAVSFKLKQGMSEQELWRELTNVGISGETTQEVVYFKEPEKDHKQILIQETDNKKGDSNKRFFPLHEVMLANKEYAIIRKNFRGIDPFGSISRKTSYYFCGINDEGKYFIRPLKNFPLDRYQGNLKPTIEDVVSWVNREDEGFDTRLQGDVLAKFVSIEDPKLQEAPSTRIRQPDPFARALVPSPRALFAPQERNSVERSLTTQLTGSFQARSQEIVIVVEGNKYSEITDSPLKLGNHKLFTEGRIFASKEVPFICIMGESLILQHYEHQIKELVIPDKCVAILAAQRGRDFELKDLHYLRQSYD